MAITISFHDYGIQNGLIRLAVALNKEWIEVLPAEMRLICVELVKYTQPFGTEETSSKIKGEIAVRRDIGKVFKTPSRIYNELKNLGHEDTAKSFWKRYKNGDTAGMQSIIRSVASLNAGNATVGELNKQLYTQRRNARGRIVGKELSRVVLYPGAFLYFMQLKVDKVGYAKSGWATCARQLGGIRDIPGWVHHHKAPGEVDNRARYEPRPYVRATNMVNYTSSVLSESNKKAVLRDRMIKMNIRVDKILNAQAKKHLK